MQILIGAAAECVKRPATCAGMVIATLNGMTVPNAPDPLLPMSDVTGVAIGVFYDVYNELGGGFPEFVYCRATAIALRAAGLQVQEEVRLPVWFREQCIVTFRVDMIIDPGLLIEVKAVPEIHPFHRAQVLHYLKASDIEVGLLFNFGRTPEFRRVVCENVRKRHSAHLKGLEQQNPESPADSNPSPEL